MPFGEELVHYAIGPASCAVPGMAAGLQAAHRAFGRLPWRLLLEPAILVGRPAARAGSRDRADLDHAVGAPHQHLG